jgi:diguanylate cyclase (GGDEF)-like protein
VAVCLLGLLTHFSFIFLFDYWGVPSLSYFNIVSSLLWAWALIEVLRGFAYRSVYIGSMEILLHAVIAMSVLGLNSGFDLYLWPLAAWLAYHPEIKHRFALIAGSGSIILWVLGHLYWSDAPDPSLPSDTLEMMLRVNATIAGLAFIFVIISARVIVARHSRLLTAQADRDALTGLYNRHYLTGFINKFEQDNLPDRRAYALIMTDIDRFKAVNDQYGHEMGDKVIQTFSACLQNSVRKEDLVCRWGGEEFIIILPKCDLEKAISKAEAMRRAIAEEIIGNEQDQSVSVTSSFGVTLHTDGECFSDLVARADKLLYQAKKSGRNRVVAQ